MVDKWIELSPEDVVWNNIDVRVLKSFVPRVSHNFPDYLLGHCY